VSTLTAATNVVAAVSAQGELLEHASSCVNRAGLRSLMQESPSPYISAANTSVRRLRVSEVTPRWGSGEKVLPQQVPL
jgi:hypothetical protein